MNMDTKVKRLTWNKGSAFALKLNNIAMWPLGLWPCDCDAVFSYMRLLFSSTSQLYMVLTQWMAVCLSCGNPDDIVDYLMMSVCSIMALTKIIAIRVHMDKIRIIFNSALDDWVYIVNNKIEDIVMPFVKTGRFTFKFQFTSCCLTNTVIIISTLPFLVPPNNNGTSWDNETALLQKQLPLKTGCMFGHYRNAIYAPLYVYESVTIMMAAAGNVGSDVFLFCLMMHLCGQFELLKTDLLEMGKGIKNPAESHKEVVRLIQRHSRLLDMVKGLNESVSGMLVIQLISNLWLYLMLGIRVIMSVSRGIPADAVRASIAFIIIILQMYQFSYASDRLSQQSESVVNALYGSEWYKLPVNLRKDLCFMAMRANKPIYLMAGNFYTMNIENVKNSVKASFSYFSILRVMFDG